jgi:DNA repair protein RadC
VTHELGTIKVEAEIREENPGAVESLQDVVARYDTLGKEQKEHFYALFFNNANTVIGEKLIVLGTNDTVQTDLQDIVRTAALVNAGAAILVHNHPSDNAGATDRDIGVTQHAHDVLEKINVQLLDHVVITRDSNYSMRRKNDGPF